MTQWPELDAAGQKEVLDQLTVLLLEALPDDWQELVIEHRKVGMHSNARIGLTRADGVMRLWDPPLEAWHRFQDLKHGMYREGEGTWFGAQYRLERPQRYEVKYNWDREPAFTSEPSAEDFELEESRFPRTEPHRPDWYREGLRRA